MRLRKLMLCDTHNRPPSRPLRIRIKEQALKARIALIRSSSSTLRTEVHAKGGDGSDASALHAVVFYPHGLARFDRMAVKQVLRGSGRERRVLDALFGIAKKRHHQEIMLHAPRGTEGFYGQFNFRARAQALKEAGIPHTELVLCELALS